MNTKAGVQPTASTEAGESIVSIDQNNHHSWFELTWKDGYVGRYPYVWLRDNCRCSDCYYPSCHQRSMLLANLDLDIKPTRAELRDDGSALQISWSDNHSSLFSAKWLHLHRFDKTDFDPIRKFPVVSWGSEFVDKIPTFKYDDVMTNSRSLYSWLQSLVKYGLAIISGSPREEDIMKTICARVAFHRVTCYGPDFRVENIFESSNIAYTAVELALHVDLPYYKYRPGVQLLHCIRQCEQKGGESQFVDAKRVVEQLQREEPELYEVMTKVKLDFRALATDFITLHMQHARPLIELDDNGQLKSLAHNDGVRAPYMDIPVEQVATVYKAIKKFHQAIYRKDNFIEIKLKEGEIVTMDNNRVMHGRSAYTTTVEGGKNKSRLLIGGYLDWDEIHSRLRLLDEELHGTPRL